MSGYSSFKLASDLWKNIVTYLYLFPLEKQEIPMSSTCNGHDDCEDKSDENICKGNHDKKSYAIISAILGKVFKLFSR